MSLLFSEFQLRSITSRNRIMVSPMCQYSASDGFANDWHFVHLGSRAVGGAGIVMTEATAINPEGRISFADLGIWKDEHIDGLARITKFITENGAVPAIQLAHAGRKASKNQPWAGGIHLPEEKGGWQTVAPSPIPYTENEPDPHELSKTEIDKTIKDFVSATKRALTAGFKIFEIHAAHGYLVHQFLSPLSNRRIDQYGGSFENRIRFLLEVTEQVRAIIPTELPLVVRISASDWVNDQPSWDIEQSVELAKILKTKGVDFIDVSSGGLSEKQKIKGGTGYQVPFSDRIRKESGIATGTVGEITKAHQAETILKTGQADLIIIARELLRNPYFPLYAAKELRDNITWPVQYERAKL